MNKVYLVSCFLRHVKLAFPLLVIFGSPSKMHFKYYGLLFISCQVNIMTNIDQT